MLKKNITANRNRRRRIFLHALRQRRQARQEVFFNQESSDN